MKKRHRKQLGPTGKSNVKVLGTAPKLKAKGAPKLKSPVSGSKMKSPC